MSPQADLSHTTTGGPDRDLLWHSPPDSGRFSSLAFENARLTRENARLEREVARLRSLAAQKDDLALTVTHELRTPLTSVLGYLELVDDEAASRDHLTVVRRNAERLLRIVDTFLHAERIESAVGELALEQVDVSELVTRKWADLAAAAEARGLHASSAVEPALHVVADPAHLEDVLENLLSNAVKYTRPGGEVRVTLRRTADHAVLAISDTGIGVPDEEQPRLFDRFFRASNAAKAGSRGTGLGLGIAKQIIELHGGTIEFTSTVDVGTEFVVRLPCAAARASSGQIAAHPVHG